MITRTTAYAREAMLQALADMVDAATKPGTLEIYGGVQPDSPDEGPGDRPLLARLTFSKPAFGRPARRAIGARPIGDSEAIAAGQATWARIRDGDGNPIIDFDVGETGATLNLSNVSFQPGDNVSVAALVLVQPAG